MKNKMPYYVTYPDDDYVDEDKMYSRDSEYMKGLYPQMAKLLWPFIVEECDRLEYEGSLIYDAYPDKLMLSLICARTGKKAIVELQKQGQLFSQDDEYWIKEIVEILVYEELCKRRKTWRKNKRRWY